MFQSYVVVGGVHLSLPTKLNDVAQYVTARRQRWSMVQSGKQEPVFKVQYLSLATGTAVLQIIYLFNIYSIGLLVYIIVTNSDFFFKTNRNVY